MKHAKREHVKIEYAKIEHAKALHSFETTEHAWAAGEFESWFCPPSFWASDHLACLVLLLITQRWIICMGIKWDDPCTVLGTMLVPDTAIHRDAES